MIACHDVRYAYGAGGFTLVAERLEIPAGLTLLLGRNGTGKSTLLRLLAGVERPAAGRVTIEGHDAWSDEVAARAGLVWVPEHPDLTPYASVDDVLQLVAALRRAGPGAAAEALVRAGLEGLGRRSIRELSLGQRRRAMFAAAFIGEPRVVLLDEPLEALDRSTRTQILVWIGDLVAALATVVVATHDIAPFENTATRALVVEGGRPRTIELPVDASQRATLLQGLAGGIPGEATPGT